MHVDSEKLADFLLGAPLAVLVIVIGAAIVDRILTRTLKRGLHSSGIGERLSAVRA